jgi:subtilisin family serine protease
LKLFRNTLLLCLAAAPLTSTAETSPTLRNAGSPANIRLAGADDAAARKVYIVQLREPAAATAYARSSSPGLKSLPGARGARLDKHSAFVRSYVNKLESQQQEVIAKAGTDVEQIYSYAYGFNGFAAAMSAATAHRVEHMPEVLGVWEDEVRPLATNFSADFLGLFDGDGGLRGAEGLDGENVVIGFIDSGVYPEHPALEDTREADRPGACSGSWAENTLLGRWLCGRYRRADDVLVYDPPEDWNGECQAGEEFEATACNNKLIGARWFSSGAEATGPIDTNEIFSARDVDGHGTHTATTAAGNRVRASIYGTEIDSIEGIAPRARVAVYKACWLRPGEQRASCNTSDLASAIDAAVADGVDIINYSVGSSLMRIAAPDDIALAAAAKAGVFAVVAAGNDGPNLGTIGSPAGGPWVLTTAASTRDGRTSLEAMEVLEPPAIAGRYASREAAFTPDLADAGPVEGLLVLADDDDETLADGGAGTTSDACEGLVNGDEMDGNVALVQRGGCDFDVKVQNAADAGASAVIVYSVSGTPVVMQGSTGLSDIPAVMVGQADGNLFIEELDAGNDVTVLLEKGLLLEQEEDGNRMAGFSARGPGPVPDILKPDVTAPGVNILAGFTPDAVNKTPGERYGYLSGTSMATPHVAGAAALLLEKNPGWTPAMLKSALMTTARTDVSQASGEGPANPFDFGAGHIVPNDAVDPGLVFDAGDDDYDAYACGLGIPAVTAGRCDELAIAGASFEPEDLNQPSVAVARLTSRQTVTRRVTHVGDEPATYVAAVEPPPGMNVVVDPPTLALAPGETASFDVTLLYQSGTLDQWRFGSLTWTSEDHDVRSTLAVRPAAIAAPAEVTGTGASGSSSFAVDFGYTGVYDARVHGLDLPLVIDGFVDNDPTKTFSFRSVDGVTAHLIDVPAGQLYVRFATFDAFTDGDDDLDMYVYYCANEVDCTRIGESGEPTSQERFDYFRPPAGRYAVLMHGFETDEVAGGPGANYKLLAWSVGEFDDRGNLDAAGPEFVNAGMTDSVAVDWAGLPADTIAFGAVSHNTPSGLSGLTLVTIVVPRDGGAAASQ